MKTAIRKALKSAGIVNESIVKDLYDEYMDVCEVRIPNTADFIAYCIDKGAYLRQQQTIRDMFNESLTRLCEGI